MTYASDKLHSEVIRPMMARLASKVKVREIVPCLLCLTQTDREEIEAKREVAGNYNAMVYLLDCLCRRDKWPEIFIEALEKCEHTSLAAEISDAYDRIRGINNNTQRNTPAAPTVPVAPAAAPAAPANPVPAAAAFVPAAANPGSLPAPVPVTTSAAASLSPVPVAAPAPATTVTTATIHTVPQSTPPLLIPNPVEGPAQITVPAPEPLPNITIPAALVSAPEAPVPPPPEPVQPAEPSPPVSAPSARPSSPVLPVQKASFPEQNEVSVNSGSTLTLDTLADLTPSVVHESSLSSAAATSTSSSQPKSHPTPSPPSSAPEESKIPLVVTKSPTSTKHPIQDTNPPEKVTVLTQDSISSTVNQRTETVHTMPQNSQSQEASQRTAQMLPSTSNDVVPGHLPRPAAERDDYFSKPGPLAEPSVDTSYELQISRPPTEAARTSSLQPARPALRSSPIHTEKQSQEVCSVSSDELMFSSSTRASGSSSMRPVEDTPSECTNVATEDVANSPPTAPEILLPNSAPEENSYSSGDVPFTDHQPVEDHYESYPQSLVREHNVQFSEEPQFQNLNGQPPSLIRNAVPTNENPASLNQSSSSEIIQCTQRKVHTSEQTGAACAEPAPPTYQESGLNASGLISTPEPEQREEPQGVLAQLQPDTRFIATAAAIGVAGLAAVFMAWKLKH